MSCRHLICGLDGGGTSTRCALSDGSSIIAFSRKGSSNIYAVGFETALNNVIDGIEECLLSVSMGSLDLDSLHFSSAGLGDDRNRRLFVEALSRVYHNAQISVSDDAYPLLWSSGLDGTGVCAISGTGSIAFGINSEGIKVRSGGYGWRLGDEGSAFHIAHEAIRMSVRASEGIEESTLLSQDVLDHFCFVDIHDAIYYVNGDDVTKSMIADFAPQVLRRAYEDRDSVAVSIVNNELCEFSKYVLSVIDRMHGIYDRKIVLAGGLVEKSPEYASSLVSLLRNCCPGWDIMYAEKDAAVIGSLKLADRRE